MQYISVLMCIIIDNTRTTIAKMYITIANYTEYYIQKT